MNDSFPVAFALFLVVAGIIAVLCIRLLTRRKLGSLGNSSSADTVMEPLAGIFGLLLAVVVSAGADRVAQLRSAVDEEAAALAQLQRIAELLPDPPATELHHAIQSVTTGSRAGTDLNRVWQVIATFQARDEHELVLQTEALTQLRDIADHRKVVAHASAPWPHAAVWTILLVGSTCLLIVCVVAGLADPRAPLYLAVLTTMIVVTLFAIYWISHTLTAVAKVTSLP